MATPVQDKVAGKIAKVLLKLADLFVICMNRIFGKMSPVKISIVVAVFCILNGGLSIYFFTAALVSKPHQTIKVDAIRLPKHFDKTGGEIYDGDIPDEIYKQLRDYKRYADSAGIVMSPGLLDSIQVLEDYYSQQNEQLKKIYEK